MPEQIEALWGPVPLGRLPPGIDNKCKAVTHRYLFKFVFLQLTVIYDSII